MPSTGNMEIACAKSAIGDCEITVEDKVTNNAAARAKTESLRLFLISSVPKKNWTTMHIDFLIRARFDKTPCKDPHVENTSQIGYFEILKVKKTGKNSYKFVFTVK
jgi:Ser-tRNA(Ala) deacylase AlaX